MLFLYVFNTPLFVHFHALHTLLSFVFICMQILSSLLGLIMTQVRSKRRAFLATMIGSKIESDCSLHFPF